MSEGKSWEDSPAVRRPQVLWPEEKADFGRTKPICDATFMFFAALEHALDAERPNRPGNFGYLADRLIGAHALLGDQRFAAHISSIKE